PGPRRGARRRVDGDDRRGDDEGRYRVRKGRERFSASDRRLRHARPVGRFAQWNVRGGAVRGDRPGDLAAPDGGGAVRGRRADLRPVRRRAATDLRAGSRRHPSGPSGGRAVRADAHRRPGRQRRRDGRLVRPGEAGYLGRDPANRRVPRSGCRGRYLAVFGPHRQRRRRHDRPDDRGRHPSGSAVPGTDRRLPDPEPFERLGLRVTGGRAVELRLGDRLQGRFLLRWRRRHLADRL
ncbi:MAG: hypothetical protein ACK55I_15280, partial [bacterium]